MEIMNDDTPKKQIVDFLNSEHDGWGSIQYYEWKFDKFPDYKKEHTFYIKDGEDIVAFRRAVLKELCIDNNNIQVIIWAYAAVSEKSRGQGLFSKIRDFSNDKIDTRHSSIEMSVVSKINIPFKSKVKKGWEYRDLPYYFKILSTKKVLKDYLDDFIGKNYHLTTLIEKLGKYVVLKIEEEKINLNVLAESEKSSFFKFKIEITQNQLKRFVESYKKSKSLKETIINSIKIFLDKDSRENDRKAKRGVTDYDFEIVHKNSLSETEKGELYNIYSKTLNLEDISFRRDQEDIEHMLDYPHLKDIILIKKDEIQAFAVLGDYFRTNMLELRVLDMRWTNRDAFQLLTKEIEKTGEKTGADLIISLSNEDLGPTWIKLNSNALLWDIPDNEMKNKYNEILKTSPLKVGFYDLL